MDLIWPTGLDVADIPRQSAGEIGSKGGAAILLYEDAFDGRSAQVKGPVLHFLFSAGQRPSRDALRRVIAPSLRFRIGDHLTSGPGGAHVVGASGIDDRRDANRLEVIVDGLGFDVLGLEPGVALSQPDIAHYADGPIDLVSDRVEVVTLTPGPHIASASGERPIVRAMMELAVGLATAWTRSTAVVWSPARMAATPGFFSRAMARWVGGGSFPTTALVGFAEIAGPQGEVAFRSEGAAFFVGQEVEVSGSITDIPEMAKGVGSRVVNHLIANGSVSDVAHIQGRDGAVLRLSPSNDGRLLHVTSAA